MNATTRLSLLTHLQKHPLFSPTAPVPVSLWSGHAPDEAPPPVVLLTLDADKRLLSHSGPVALAEAQLSVDVWAEDEPTALALRQAAVSQLHGFAGEVVVDDGQGGTPRAEITRCIHEASSEDFDAGMNLTHAHARFSLGYRA